MGITINKNLRIKNTPYERRRKNMDLSTTEIIKSLLQGIEFAIEGIKECFKMYPYIGILALVITIIPNKKRR